MRHVIALGAAATLISTGTVLAAQFPSSGKDLGAVTGGTFKEAHLVIDKKCVSCHTAERIESAIAAGKDMQKIQHRMELKGVKLTADEQSVLGIFYKQSPLKQKK